MDSITHYFGHILKYPASDDFSLIHYQFNTLSISYVEGKLARKNILIMVIEMMVSFISTMSIIIYNLYMHILVFN